MLLFRFSRATLNIFLFNNGHNLYSSTHSVMINRNDNFNVKNERKCFPYFAIPLYRFVSSAQQLLLCAPSRKKKMLNKFNLQFATSFKYKLQQHSQARECIKSLRLDARVYL